MHNKAPMKETLQCITLYTVCCLCINITDSHALNVRLLYVTKQSQNMTEMNNSLITQCEYLFSLFSPIE